MYEEFKKFRDIAKFNIVKKNVSKHEYKLFQANYPNQRLIYTKIYTRSKIVFNKKYPVEILCTVSEEFSIIVNSDRIWEEYYNILSDTKCFKDKYIIALEKLLYIKFYSFFKLKYKDNLDYFYEPYYNSFMSPEGLIAEEFKESYSYDDLAIFLKHFKYTFK